MKSFYIDLGSSTIKVYCYEKELKLMEENSIYFKNDFDAVKGISEKNLKELCDYFKNIKKKYNLRYDNTNIFVTGIFRNLIPERKQELVKLFNDEFDLHFNIISHGIENYYLAKAMENDYNGKKVLIINMGGKTTELVTFIGSKITDTKNLNLGVADLLNAFSKVNEKYSGDSLEDMEKFVSEKLINIESRGNQWFLVSNQFNWIISQNGPIAEQPIVENNFYIYGNEKRKHMIYITNNYDHFMGLYQVNSNIDVLIGNDAKCGICYQTTMINSSYAQLSMKNGVWSINIAEQAYVTCEPTKWGYYFYYGIINYSSWKINFNQ